MSMSDLRCVGRSRCAVGRWDVMLTGRTRDGETRSRDAPDVIRDVDSSRKTPAVSSANDAVKGYNSNLLDYRSQWNGKQRQRSCFPAK